MAISQVALSNTFNEFRSTFNDAANTVNTLVPSANAISANTLSLGGTTDASSTTTGTLIVAGGVGVAKKLYVGTDLSVAGDATFTGNVIILGSNSEISTTQINVNDPLIQLANNNTSNTVDIGVFGQYNSGSGNVHSGVFRDASDGTWKFFKDYNIEPGTTIDPAANGFSYANVSIGALSTANNISIGTGQAYQINGANVLSSTVLGSTVLASSLTSVGTLTTLAAGNTTITGTITATGGIDKLTYATGAISVAGSSTPSNGQVLDGSTDVTVAQGGTGLSTLTLNNVILGNGTSTPLFVAPGSSANVLTSNGTTWVSTAPAAGGVTTGKAIAMALVFGG